MIKIALLGFGNVGRAFARHLCQMKDPSGQYGIFAAADISGGILLQDAEDVRRLLETQEHWHVLADCTESGAIIRDSQAYIDALPGAGISALVECMPTNPADGQPALSLLKRALGRGIAVVTVDKGPIVHGFQVLHETARRSDTRLAYSGTTGVRPPPGVAGCHILEIRGILNGTTNYILTEMQERGLTFKEALANAKAQGIAEPDPDLDLRGWDTACKILILANEWMNAGATLDDVVRIGIGPETESLMLDARACGGVVRLIGRARVCEGRLRLSVAPKIVAHDSVFHSISGTSKGAVFRTREKGEIFAGGLSGREAIAKIILEDIQAVTRQP